MSNVRTKLIEATFEEVFETGYSGASLANILLKADVKKGAMYHYFSSKKQMVLSMIEEKFSSMLHQKWKHLRDRPGNKIDLLIESFQDTSQWNLVDGCPLGNLLQESLDKDEDFTNALIIVLDQWHNYFREVLFNAQKLNQIRSDVDVNACSIFLISSIEGSLLLNKKYSDTKRFEDSMGQLTHYLSSLRS